MAEISEASTEADSAEKAKPNVEGRRTFVLRPSLTFMHIRHRDQIEPYQTKDTSVIRELLHPANSPVRHQSLAEATVPPGATTEAHFHPRSEEIYYVLSGRGEMAIEAEQSTLQTGDAVVIPPGSKHQIRNTGEADLRFLCCCSPSYSHGDTVLCESLLKPLR